MQLIFVSTGAFQMHLFCGLFELCYGLISFSDNVSVYNTSTGLRAVCELRGLLSTVGHG